MSAPSVLKRRASAHWIVALLVAAITSRSAQAATPLATLSISTDTTVALGAVTVADENVVLDDLAGGVGAVALGALPGESAIVAYHRTAGGEHLIVLETTVVLGAVTATPADVVRIDSGLLASLELDGSVLGIPAGVGIDALTKDGGDYLLSFDVTVTLGGATFDDEDLARWDGSTFSLAFDGSLLGVDPSLDLDAAHWLGNGHLLLSFDGSAAIGTVASHDEDVLEYSAGPTWELAFDGSVAHAELSSTDIDAVFAEHLGEVSIFADGFESGDTSAWSSTVP